MLGEDFQEENEGCRYQGQEDGTSVDLAAWITIRGE
jgi:hypothetical protein